MVLRGMWFACPTRGAQAALCTGQAACLRPILIEAFQYAARRLAGTGIQEKGKYGIVLAIDDSDLTRELHGTVAVKQLTGTKFIPPEGQEHRTDALRCLAMGRRAQTRVETNIERGGSWLEEAGVYEIQPLYGTPINVAGSGWRWGRVVPRSGLCTMIHEGVGGV